MRLSLDDVDDGKCMKPEHTVNVLQFQMRSNNECTRERATNNNSNSNNKTSCNEMITALKRHINNKPAPAIWTMLRSKCNAKQYKIFHIFNK